MPGLVPGIHVLLREEKKAWMAGTNPAMTMQQDGRLELNSPSHAPL
jgi:hypothetical protein